MKNKFLLGAVAGVTSLLVAVPLIAQMSNAQGVSASSTTPAVQTQTAASAVTDSEVNDPAGNDQNEINDGTGTDTNEVKDAAGSDKNEPEDGNNAQDANEQPGTENPNN